MILIRGGIDLHSGHIFANVEDRHQSIECIGLLKQLDEHHPEEAMIRVVLDSHSAHISKETMAYLSSCPGRFEYVPTPKHGSWLNLIDCIFSKTARTFLRHIRVTSKDDLNQRILQRIAEINASPVVFRWNKFDLGVTEYAFMLMERAPRRSQTQPPVPAPRRRPVPLCSPGVGCPTTAA